MQLWDDEIELSWLRVLASHRGATLLDAMR
jgi:hypothetical protein